MVDLEPYSVKHGYKPVNPMEPLFSVSEVKTLDKEHELSPRTKRRLLEHTMYEFLEVCKSAGGEPYLDRNESFNLRHVGCKIDNKHVILNINPSTNQLEVGVLTENGPLITKEPVKDIEVKTLTIETKGTERPLATEAKIYTERGEEIIITKGKVKVKPLKPLE